MTIYFQLVMLDISLDITHNKVNNHCKSAILNFIKLTLFLGDRHTPPPPPEAAHFVL